MEKVRQSKILETLECERKTAEYYRIWFCDLQLGLRFFFGLFLFTYSLHSLSLFSLDFVVPHTPVLFDRVCVLFFSEENTVQTAVHRCRKDSADIHSSLKHLTAPKQAKRKAPNNICLQNYIHVNAQCIYN